MELEAIDDDEPVTPNRPKTMSPKNRFRAIVRLVMQNIPWLIDSEVKFGTKLYAMKKTMKSILALEHKAILNKDPADRTAEENDAIYKIIGGFKCFRKYPEHVKMMLASYSHFCYFGPDRVIVRENHYATAIFFVISGEVNIIEETYDAFLDETERIVIETLTAGDVFGEICLLHNVPRMETIISATPVEFLILKRDDFDVVLKGTVKEEWDYISSLMQSFDYFKEWDKVRLGECCMLSVINEYNRGDTILGDGYGRKNYVHFVIEGTCSLVEHIQVQEFKNSAGRSNYKLYNVDPRLDLCAESREQQLNSKPSKMERTRNDSIFPATSLTELDERLKRKSIRRYSSSTLSSAIDSIVLVNVPKDVMTIFMQVCTFSEKACFSLGEPMTNRRIVADMPVMCLLIPAYVLLGRDTIWLRIKQFLSKRIPSTQVVFESFVKQRQWRRYKTELVRPLQISLCNNWHSNIPYNIRILNDFDYKPKPSDPTTRQELNECK